MLNSEVWYATNEITSEFCALVPLAPLARGALASTVPSHTANILSPAGGVGRGAADGGTTEPGPTAGAIGTPTPGTPPLPPPLPTGVIDGIGAALTPDAADAAAVATSTTHQWSCK